LNVSEIVQNLNLKEIHHVLQIKTKRIPVDAADEDDAVVIIDSISSSFSNVTVDTGSVSTKGGSSIIGLGVDVILIIDGELNIFGGESNVIGVLTVSDDLNI